jgi:protein CWC15
MTTAARPTYYAAIGGKQEYGGFKSKAVCAKDQIAHTKLKFRQPGQGSVKEVQNADLRYELDRKEEEYTSQKNKAFSMVLEEEKKVDVKLLLENKPTPVDQDILNKYDDADIDGGSDDGFDSSRYIFLLLQFHFRQIFWSGCFVT